MVSSCGIRVRARTASLGRSGGGHSRFPAAIRVRRCRSVSGSGRGGPSSKNMSILTAMSACVKEVFVWMLWRGQPDSVTAAVTAATRRDRWWGRGAEKRIRM